ncbi:MAG: hypothetical protein ACJ780_14180, partial [Solirubrobacteraceae bacterium]
MTGAAGGAATRVVPVLDAGAEVEGWTGATEPKVWIGAGCDEWAGLGDEDSAWGAGSGEGVGAGVVLGGACGLGPAATDAPGATAANAMVAATAAQTRALMLRDRCTGGDEIGLSAAQHGAGPRGCHGRKRYALCADRGRPVLERPLG